MVTFSDYAAGSTRMDHLSNIKKTLSFLSQHYLTSKAMCVSMSMPSQSQCPSIMFIDRITHGLNGNALPPCGDESAGSMSKFLEQHQSFPPYSVHSCSILDNPNESKWRNEQDCPSRIPPNIKHGNVSCFAAMQSPNLTRDQHAELHSIRRRELVAFWMT